MDAIVGGISIAVSLLPLWDIISLEVSLPLIIGIQLASVTVLVHFHQEQIAKSLRDLIRPLGLHLNAQEMIDNIGDLIFSALAQTKLEEIHATVQRIGDGHVTYNYGNDRELIIRSVKFSKSHVFATHYVGTSDLTEMWLNDPIQRNYLQANLDAVRRNVHVERMFIVNPTRNMDISTNIVRILEEQERGGINIFVLFENDLPSNWTEDFVVIDDKRLHIYHRGSSRLFERVDVIVERRSIQKKVEQFERLKLRSTPWDKSTRDTITQRLGGIK